MKIINITTIIIIIGLFNCMNGNLKNYFILNQSDLPEKIQHTQHYEYYSKYTTDLNKYVLKGIDRVQATAIEGGGYFIGIKANPPESPIGYNLRLFDKSLLTPTRSTSYCSGASYSAFIEAMNLITTDLKFKKPDSIRIEAMRMQETDGSRREDHEKYWGKWNADGFGSHFALVQYSGMGKEVHPSEARPGDFANISWKSGLGHSVVFLAWVKDEQENKYILYWSSQKSTNGLSDQLVSLDKIKTIKIVRLTHPEKILTFDIDNTNINTKIAGDEIDF